MKNEKYYVAENEEYIKHGYFNSFCEAYEAFENLMGEEDFTVSEYDTEEDYYNSL